MLMRFRCALALLVSAPLSNAIRDDRNDFMNPKRGSMAAYETFLQEFGVKRHHEDHSAYQGRIALFEQRLDEVKAHNAQSKPWFAVVNKFADYTGAEFQGLLGHRLSERGRAAGASQPEYATSLLQSMPQQELAESIDWSQHNLSSLARTPKNQGACGSCWAVAAAGAVETHLEMTGQQSPEVSYEQLVDCVENPQECGGTGGCKGATSELAFEYISKHGLASKQDYHGYQSQGDGHCRPPSQTALMVKGFVRLATNNGPDLRAAVATKGTVVVSADASGWSMYGGGVYNDCAVDATINHAILMMGYDTDKDGGDYWLIRNSWGSDWGEDGYIRLFRHKDDETFCGVDRKPLDGVGCKGGPVTLPVCGMCGILADSAYPTGVKAVKETRAGHGAGAGSERGPVTRAGIF